MKTKFHLTKRTPSRAGFGSSTQAQGPEQAVALVDERYLGWLAAQHGGEGNKTIQRGALMPVLANLVRLCGPDLQLLRTCLFTDKAPTELHDDVLPRLVPQHAVDGGLGMVRALGQELTQIAQRGACGLVLLATDDERLIPYIDEAQWRGLKVVLITDEVSQDHGKLMSEDPSWARLLMQADRRLAFNDMAWQTLTGAVPSNGYFAARANEPGLDDMAGEDMPSNEPPTDDWRAQVEQVIQEWWAEETPDTRLDLYEEMHGSQGVPPETDRHLLLRVRREMGRTLSFPEKKSMREMIRSTVLAQRPEVDESLSA
ncbi:MAG TPA: hypothetical protein VFY31_03665 [Macromonas sp.]|nr:hypothetical protein [Macromonas sp.]